MQDGGAGLQDGGAGLQPGGAGLQDGGAGLQPGGAGLRHLAEAHGVDAGVARGGASAADDVRRLQDLTLGGALELVVLFLVGLRELAQLLLEHAQLVQLCLVGRVEVAHLVVQREVLDAAVDRLPRLCAEAEDAQPRLVDLLGELVDGHVGGRAHEGLALQLLGEVVDDRGGGDCLARAGRALHHGEGLLQHRLDCEDLRVVELGQSGRAEAARHGHSDRRLLHLVAEEPVVDVAGDRGLVHREGLERGLHAVVGDGLPHEVHREAVVRVDGHVRLGAQLDAHLLRGGEAHHRALALPRGAEAVARVAQLQLVPRDEAHVCVLLREGEVGDALLVKPHVPAHGDPLLRLRLLHLLVVVGLELDQRPHDVLVLVGVLVAHLHRGGLRVVQVACKWA